MTLIKRGDTTAVKEIRRTASFKGLKKLIELRKQLPALRKGLTSPLWVDSRQEPDDDGLYIFARYLPGEPEKTVIVSFNLSGKRRSLEIDLIGKNQEKIIPKGRNLKRFPLLGIRGKTNEIKWAENARARIDLPLESVGIWVVE